MMDGRLALALIITGKRASQEEAFVLSLDDMALRMSSSYAKSHFPTK